MDGFLLAILVGVVGYLIGNISPARLIGRFVLPGQRLDNVKVDIPNSEEADIRYRGVSATSVAAKGGVKWGILIGVLDALKAVIPMWLCTIWWPDSNLHLVVAVMVMVGHNWPVVYSFKGGRGQSALIGALLFIDPLSVLVCFPVGIVVGLFILRDMFTAYTAGQYLLIVWFFFFGTSAEVAFAIAVNIAYTVAAIPEARDYLKARSEGKIGKIESLSDFFTAHPAISRKKGKSTGADGD